MSKTHDGRKPPSRDRKSVRLLDDDQLKQVVAGDDRYRFYFGGFWYAT